MGISKQGDAMARHCLYEAANVLLTTVKKRFALRNWGLRLVKTQCRGRRLRQQAGPDRLGSVAARKTVCRQGIAHGGVAHGDGLTRR